CASARSLLGRPPFPTRRSSDLSVAAPTLHRVHRERLDAVLGRKFTPRRGRKRAIWTQARGDVCSERRKLLGRQLGLWTASPTEEDRKSTRLNSNHVKISYAVFC